MIGSGPASVSFAYQMARRGYEVSMYERHDLPGGMLRHAIPDYRLPREILDAEVQRVLDLNISLQLNVDFGRDVTLAELRDRHVLLFLGLGAQGARDLDIPGEQGPGVISGIDYLQQRKQSVESQQDKRVLVVGGGNTAIDAGRICIVGASYSAEEAAESARSIGAPAAFAAISPGSLSETTVRGIDQSRVPWLFVVTREDPFLASHIGAIQDLSRTAELLLIPGNVHGTDLLDVRPDLAPRIAAWLALQVGE